LYRVGDVYFVLDGNHRVSVAKRTGIGFIDAEVTEIETRVPLTDTLDADELEIKGEYAHFLGCTRLDKLRPEQRIEFTVGGGYQQLLEHIAVHRYAMEQEERRPIDEDEAVCDWYDHRYLPLVEIIREQQILSDFPKRTEADLYLWITEHQHYLRDLCGPDVIIEQVAQHFADRHGASPIKRVANAVREMLSDPTAACQLVTGDEGAAAE
jgi:hypothetical protein